MTQHDTTDGRIADEHLPHTSTMIDEIPDETSRISSDSGPPISRRNLLKAVGVTGAALSFPTNKASAHAGFFKRPEASESLGEGVAQVEAPDGINFDTVVGTCEDLDAYIDNYGVSETNPLGEQTHVDSAVGTTSWDIYVDETIINEKSIADDDKLKTIVGPDTYQTRTVTEGDVEYLEAYGFDAEFTVKTSISIIDWRPTINISRACRQAWCEELRTTIEHERQHEQDMIEAAERATDRWQGDGSRDDWPRAKIWPWETPQSREVRESLGEQILSALVEEYNSMVKWPYQVECW